ncbi:MAG: hypothetical protein R2806_15820 [Saprospiraceae bacterium]
MERSQVNSKPWYVLLNQLADYLIHYLGEGKAFITLSHVINAHKGGILVRHWC